MARMELHLHTEYSNLRLIDSINKHESVIERAISLGLCGVSFSDHECLSGSVEIDKLREKYQKTHPDFKIACGNEIYLVDERGPGQKYWHFLLTAKDAIGHKQLRELSSIAWLNSYYDRGMERVPTLKEDLKRIISKNPGHVIASTACLGSELDFNILELDAAEKIGDANRRKEAHDNIVKLITFCKDLFKDDFYLEVQPAQSEEQLIVNNRMPAISKAFGVKMIVTTDAHYLKKEDRWVHKAYLNSKQLEREVDAFYEFAYLQSTEEVIENLKGTNLDYYELEANTKEIWSKIENYSLKRNQRVQQVPVREERKREKSELTEHFVKNYPVLSDLLCSEDPQERYWVNECINKMKKLNLYNEKYLERLEYEADIKKTVGNNLGTCVFAYPTFLQHFIDLFWDCGSPVGAGRGSAGSGLNHYLLDITQVDPIKADLPFFRYMNKDRAEMPDIDIDLAPSRREDIFKKIKEERGELGCVQVCTFSTETTKSAILTACRGYTSPEYPFGIDVDTAQYLSSLVPIERGFLWPIKDVVYGNEEKGRKPNKAFINCIQQYEGLLDIIIQIEGLVKNRSIHASGVIFYDEDPYDSACFMKATNGSIITQYSLHDAEYCGDVKFDFLVTEQMDIEAQCIKLLQENGYIEKELTLREAYNKYVHPDKLPLEDSRLWDAIDKANILGLFQLNTAVGGNIVRQLKPRNVEELTACNSLMRLMGEEGQERPSDRYARLKEDISEWYKEMDLAGLTKEEQAIMEKYCLVDYGAPSSQETLMLILMDKDVCDFTLAEANAARKLVAKKKMNEIPAFKEKVFERAKSKALGQYIWHSVIGPQLG